MTNSLLTAVRPGLAELIEGVRGAVDRHADWQRTAELVAAELRRNLPALDVLTAEEQQGSPDRYQSGVLYVDPAGAFSVVSVVWRPGQITPIHDHVTWCAFGVLQGVEYEELYALRDTHLEKIGENANGAGSVDGFAPPGDIHRVHNSGDQNAISIHIYGTDVSRIESSVRRVYVP
jgi:3-mercaptopropionate dioxygenase